MTTEQKIIRAKVGLLELAQQLGNVSQACKMMGYAATASTALRSRLIQMRARPLFQPNELTGSPFSRNSSNKFASSFPVTSHPDQSDIFIVPMLTLDRAIRLAWSSRPHVST